MSRAYNKSKYWCFTLNNYTPEEEYLVKNMMEGNLITYCCIGKEVGEQGTPHLQGYVEFKSRWDIKRLKEWFISRAHFERRRGTCEQAAEYCQKEGNYYEIGIPSSFTLKQCMRNLELMFEINLD